MVRLHAFRRAVGIEGATLGPLASLSLAEIAQVLSLGGKTARVDLRAGGERGSVWFVSGTPVHAECGRSITGAPAFYRMLGWTRGDFVIQHAATTEKRSLEGDPMYHVLEGLRRVDEQGDGSPPVPLPPIPEPGDSSQRPKILLGVLLVSVVAAALWLWAPPDSATAEPLAEPAAARPAAVDTPAASRRARPAAKRSKQAAPVVAVPSAGKPARQVVQEKELEPAPSLPEPVASAPESMAAAAEARPGAVEGAGDPRPVTPSGRVGLVLRSKLKEGMLTLVVDGQPAYTMPLKKTSASLWQRVGDERFDATISVPPGAHRLAARIDLGDGAVITTEEVSFTVEPDAVRELLVVAGAKQARPLSIEIDGASSTSPDRVSADLDPEGATAEAEIPSAPLPEPEQGD